MASIFSSIVSGDIPSYKIDENEDYLAFLDVFPLAEGHTLVIPKKETDYIFDMDSDSYKELWSFAQSVAKKLKSRIECKRIGVAVIGLEVPHAHIHLVPINNVSDIDFSREKLKLSEEKFTEIAALINS